MSALKNKIVVTFLSLITVFLICFFWIDIPVFAEDIDVDTAKAQLEEAKINYDSQMSDIENLKLTIEEKNQEAIEAQNHKFQCQESFNRIAVQEYKCDISTSYFTLVFSSTSMVDFLRNIEYANLLMKNNIRVSKEQDEAIRDFNLSIKDLNNQLDQLNKKVDEANKTLVQYQAKVDEVSKKAEIPKEEITKGETIQPPEPPSQWNSGSASAYGGSSDPSSGTRTSTGATISESSMGVSIPINTPNLSSYYGRSVQIKLKGKIVIGTINDCGGLNGGSRCMDVQPGIFHSFGFSSCQDWGVQNIEYIIM